MASKARAMDKAKTSTANRISKVDTRTRSSIADNKTPMAKATSNSSKATANSKVAMDKIHTANSLRIKVRITNTTRSIMTATHRQQATVNSKKATASSSNMANNSNTAANNSNTDSRTKAPIPGPADLEHLELVQMAGKRETEAY